MTETVAVRYIPANANATAAWPKFYGEPPK